MKKIYMIQPSDTHGEKQNQSVYLPYATGLLIASAFQDETIKKQYQFCRFIYKKEDIETTINSMIEPAVAGFSNYIWNYEYNKRFAFELKKRYPKCVIVFGGHNVKIDSNEQLAIYPFIDFLIHGEGEIAFREILLHLCGDGDYSGIANISYRNNGVLKKNKTEMPPSVDYPSPYLEGWFDDIIKENGMSFSALLETNRGCPFRCSYCDWGSLYCKIRHFSFERVLAEMEWLSEHKIQYCYCANSNFGMYQSDYAIVDAFVDIKKRTGYPETFMCNTTEGGDAEYNINKKLHDCGILKGATLALQTLSPEALVNIGRKNMSFEKYSRLTARYNAAGIPTYSELIYGLPGETYESFSSNLGFLLESGTTQTCFMHYCELLMNSSLAAPESVEKFQIKTARIPYTQYHCSPERIVPEYSNIIISTYSMDYQMWVRTVRFGLFVQCFHFMGVLQCIAKYLFFEKGLSLRTFYERLIDFALIHPQTVVGSCCARITANLSALDRGKTISRVFVDSDFGEIEYPMEEGMFLEIMREKSLFWRELSDYIRSFSLDNELCENLLKYQYALLRSPGEINKREYYSYDFVSYFDEINAGHHVSLKKRPCKVVYRNDWQTEYWQDYAMRIVWYGRRAARTMYSGNEMEVELL